jgi:Mn-dependent DtxR family transcriptional regulator
MREFPPYLEEEEDIVDEEEWLERAKYEIVEFILRRYGVLRAGDIAKILNWKTKEVNSVLRNLESWGRIRRTKLGRTLAWAHLEEHIPNPMYY